MKDTMTESVPTITDPSDLEPHRISNLPPTMYYMPNFLTAAEEQHMLSSLPAHRWTQLSHRRLQAHPSPLSKTGTLLAADLPLYLASPVLDRFRTLGLFRDSPHGAPNHVLVNEYEAGQGIMGHEDGGTYWPCTATVSLGGSIVLDVWEKTTHGGEGSGAKREQRRWRVLQEPRSLLVTMDEIYGSTLHGIAEADVDGDLGPATVANWGLLSDKEEWESKGGENVRVTRTSLTYRDVIKVSNVGKKILGFGRK